MKKLIFLALAIAALNFTTYAQKSKHGAKSVAPTGTEIVNEYTSLTSDATAGDVVINVANSTLNDNGRFLTGLEAGDLLYIIQIQGATIDDSNRKNFSWGEILNYNNCGLNEYAEVTNVPNGTSIELSCPITNNYTESGKVVIVRVPRYSALTIPSTSTLTGDTWDGSIGGLVVVEVEGDIALDGTIEMSEKGFRGTSSTVNLGSTAGAKNEFASTDGSIGGVKGEGIAGYHFDYDGLQGRFGHGAAGNAGGGGLSVDAGGGGGANAGDPNNYTGKGVPDVSSNVNFALAWENEEIGLSTAVSSGGGRGGYCKSDEFVDPYNDPLNNAVWGSDGRRPNAAGLGGRPLDYSTGRLFFGGGGGQGHGVENAAGAGGAGGGLIVLTSSGSILGSGTIVTNGEDGEGNVGNSANRNLDGGGGAGAGGTIVLEAGNSIDPINLVAIGGEGGIVSNTIISFFSTYDNLVGPGGGGGGGYVKVSSVGPVIDISGGANGTMTPSVLDGVFEPNGATYGGDGQSVVEAYSVASLIAENDTVCQGETANLSVQASNLNGAIVTWYDSEFGGSIIGTGTTYSINNLASDVTVYAGVCPGTFKVPVLAKVSSSLAANVISDTVYTCSGASARLEAQGGNTFSWSPNTELDQDNQSVANITTTTSQTIYVDISQNGTCNVTDSVFVSVTPNLVVDLGDDKNICFGESVELAASGGVNYTWTPNTSISSTTSDVVTVDPTDSIMYKVVVDDGAGCSGEDSIWVNVIPELEITGPGNQELCQNEGVTLTVSHTGGSGGAVTYLWDEGVFTGNPLTNAWSQNGSMEVKVVDDTYGCADSVSFPIVVRDITVDFNYTDTCLADLTQFESNATASGSIIAYSWLIDNNIPLTGENVDYRLPNIGANEVKLIVEDDLGCKDSIVKFVNTNQPPNAVGDVSPDTVCIGRDVLYTNSLLGQTAYDFEWSFGDGSTSTSDSGRVNYSSAGDYDITLTVTDANGCSDTYEDSVTVTSGATALFTLPESVKLGENITVTNNSIDAQIFSWTSGSIVEISNDEEPVFVADEVGEKCYTLNVISAVGCKDSYEDCLIVEGEELRIPNVFSPNNDGLNDEFELVNSEGKKFELQVFNRWGILVYESPDYKSDWKGIGISGEELATGTYFVIAKDLTTANSDQINGFVYLTK